MNFSLFSDGALYRLYAWIGPAKKPPRLQQRHIFAICLFSWLPLLMLTLPYSVQFSEFISDIDIHMRLLVSLPLLLYAEGIANHRLQIVVRQFLKADLIAENDRQQYEKMIASAMKISHSPMAEVCIFFFVLTIGRWISNQVLPFDISNWYVMKNSHGVVRSFSGYWYVFVSLPIFQFFLLRWYYHILIWYRFLWQVSQLKLQLNSLHPDRTGGLGFLENHVYGLEPFLIANSVLLAGIIFNAILNSHATLYQFRHEIMTWMIMLVSIPLVPLFFFVLQLARTKRRGTNEYDILAGRYVGLFRHKWIDTQSAPIEKLLGSPDIQSLADLTNSFHVSAQMRIVPIDKQLIFFVVMITLLPFLPLILTIIPLDKMASQVISIIF